MQSIKLNSFDYFQCFFCSRPLIDFTVGAIPYEFIKIFALGTLILSKEIKIFTSNIIINFRTWLRSKSRKSISFCYKFIKDSK